MKPHPRCPNPEHGHCTVCSGTGDGRYGGRCVLCDGTGELACLACENEDERDDAMREDQQKADREDRMMEGW